MVNQESLKQGWHGLAFYLVLWLAVCLLEIAVFEGDGLTIERFVSGTWIIIKKANVSHLHYKIYWIFQATKFSGDLLRIMCEVIH